MKCCVENDVSMFEFHDSVFSFISFDGKDLVTSVRHLNIHKCTAQNPSAHDMEIECAQITFKGFYSPTYEPGRVWKMGEDGKSYPVGPRVVFSGKEAEDKILEELQNEIHIYDFSQKDDGSYFIDGVGIEPFFTIGFCFDSVTIEWDEYGKKAWYELHRQYRYDLTLATPHGEEAVAVTVCYHDEAVYHKGVCEEPPAVNVGIRYAGKELWGHGTDYLWVDAFADLQKQLPDGIIIKCCLTCMHGNMCPVGNKPDELFCTKDVTVTQKSDLFFYTEDDNERDNRSRPYCHVCEEYQPQSEEGYTYNNYSYYLDQS